MENTKIKAAFFFLLRSGLWGKNEKESAEHFFPLTDMEWSALYRRAVEQTVEGLLYDGILLLEKEHLPPRHLQIKWSVRIDRIERDHLRTNALIAEQHAFFAKRHLFPLLLKGQGVAACYRIPEHRICGDIDWYFDDKRPFTLAWLHLVKRGIPMVRGGGYVFLWEGCEMDLHERLFDLYNPFCGSLLKQCRADFPDTTLFIGGQDVTVLAPQVQIIQVTAHILKHSLAFGIGLRQFCDLASLYHTYQSVLDEKRLERLYSRLGLANWIAAVHQFLINDLGLAAEDLPFPIRATPRGLAMVDEVWNSGNFGFYDERYMQDRDGQFFARKNKNTGLLRRMIRYFPYAPKEAFWFPVIHFLNRRRG